MFYYKHLFFPLDVVIQYVQKHLKALLEFFTGHSVINPGPEPRKISKDGWFLLITALKPQPYYASQIVLSILLAQKWCPSIALQRRNREQKKREQEVMRLH